MSLNKQGAEGAFSAEIQVSLALNRLAKLRLLKIKIRTKESATDLTILALGREGTDWLGNSVVEKSPSEGDAGRKVFKVG